MGGREGADIEEQQRLEYCTGGRRLDWMAGLVLDLTTLPGRAGAPRFQECLLSGPAHIPQPYCPPPLRAKVGGRGEDQTTMEGKPLTEKDDLNRSLKYSRKIFFPVPIAKNLDWPLSPASLFLPHLPNWLSPTAMITLLEK